MEISIMKSKIEFEIMIKILESSVANTFIEASKVICWLNVAYMKKMSAFFFRSNNSAEKLLITTIKCIQHEINIKF